MCRPLILGQVMSHGGRQLALPVCSTSVTAAGSSITSTATVSTIGAIGCCFTFRAAFFAGAGLGLAVRFVAFADFAACLSTLAIRRPTKMMPSGRTNHVGVLFDSRPNRREPVQLVASRSQVETKFREHRLVAGRLPGETDIFGSGGCHRATTPDASRGARFRWHN